MAKSTKKIENYDEVPQTLDGHPFYGFQLDADQTNLRDSIWNPEKKIIFCNARAGSGKAQPYDTKIPTPEGFRNLGDISVGDYVFDRYGNPTKVLGVFPQGMCRAYKVTLTDGRSTICCDEHLWTYCRNGDNKFVTETLNSMMTRSICIGEYHKTPRYRIPTNSAVQYNKKDLPVDPYVLGLFIGDGCLTGDVVEFSTNDFEVLSSIEKEFNCSIIKYSDNNYNYRFRKSDGSVLRVDAFSSKIPQICTYSYNKSIPKDYLFGDTQQRLSLLQGLLDTDGCITVSGNRYNVSFSTVSKHLCDDIVELCRSLGYIATVHEDRRDKYINSNGVAYQVNILCDNSEKEKLFRLGRRKRLAIEAKNYTKHRDYSLIGIQSVEDLGYECEMVCIYVDNPEHLYLTNDFIVTHNTLISFATANLLYEYGLYEGIVYIVSPYGEAKQGFLPGDITEKSEVYFEPLYQAIIKCNLFPPRVIQNEAMTAQTDTRSSGYVKNLTHTYLRGTNFDKKVVILDETQNFSFDDLKKALTRANDDCKVIVIGHTRQKDTYDTTDAFERYIRYYGSMTGEDAEKVAICKLTKNYRGWISRTADELEFR